MSQYDPGYAPDGPCCPSCGAPENEPCQWPCVPGDANLAEHIEAAEERELVDDLVGFDRLPAHSW